ncbi:MAG TPA: hypothetical protein VJV79_10465 [Polyangiaceae bacterium]|nr:hypothetical protein [Polyangiaceae bacterium]
MSAEFAQFPGDHPRAGRSRIPIGAPLLAVLVSLPASVWLWGYTVDDALITARVAAHLAQGLGPRFNPHGPPADAVTPLGYAQLLSLFGEESVLGTFRLAKWLGLLTWLAAAGLLGRLMAQVGARALRFTPLSVVALSAPLAAWAVSGMETGFVTLLTTVGLCGGFAGALSLGVAAALRPELVPFAWLLVAGQAFVTRVGIRRALLLAAAAVLPTLLVALVRLSTFGRAVPLSFYAKPSDFAHGLRYALGAFAFTGLPWLLVATPREFLRLPHAARPLFAALFAHAAALVLCGGDWMAFYRLAVPVLPAAALAAAHLAEHARLAFAIPRLVLAVSGALLLALGLGPAARQVGADRAQLIARARPVLAQDQRIATLDVGWVGAASNADVIDLAGVTDPQVAQFPGGHTSKRIPGPWLFARQPSAIVLLLARGTALEAPFENSIFARAVEQRVATLIAAEFRVRSELALADQTYVVLEPSAER